MDTEDKLESVERRVWDEKQCFSTECTVSRLVGGYRLVDGTSDLELHHHHHQFIWIKPNTNAQGHVGTYRHHSNIHDRVVIAVQ